MSQSERFDAIVVGGGISGAICAATLAIRDVKTLLIAETKLLGHNMRAVQVDGRKAQVQQAAWHFGWGGGHWLKVVREHNLAVPVHFTLPIQASVRGLPGRSRLPIMMSASSVSDFLFRLLPMPVEPEQRRELERVVHVGLMIPWEQLCQMHDYPIGRWLDEQGASDLARMVIELLAAVVAGLPQAAVSDAFSVFGIFCHIRTYFGGDGSFTLIEPDPQRGFIEPCGQQVEALGGELWRGVKVDRVRVEDGQATGVRLADGRVARAPIVALAAGNTRIPAYFDSLPPELVAPFAKEAQLKHQQLMVATILNEPVVDAEESVFIHDPGTGANLWMVPLHKALPWEPSDGRQFILQWWGGVHGDTIDAVAYMDEVFEDEFPGWKSAIGTRERFDRRHHWLNPCYVGPKVPRKSDSVRGLYYVGESTAPVAGIASEQASFAGYHGALTICAELGKTTLGPPANLRGHATVGS